MWNAFLMSVTSGIPLLICKKYLVQFYAVFAQKLICYALFMPFCEQVLCLVQDHFVCIYYNEQEWQFEKKNKQTNSSLTGRVGVRSFT